MLRGIRGAITVEKNTKEEIWRAAQLLITKILSTNEILSESVGAIIFSSTNDLTAAFPTTGFTFIPLFDVQETSVEGSLPRCIRVLVLADVKKTTSEIHHIYLGGAQNLRPDLVNK